jgi:L-asparagine permease
MVCSLLLWTHCEDCRVTRARYQLPWAPDAQNQLLMYADKGAYSTTVLCLPLAVAAPVGGCFVARRRVDTIPSAAVVADSEFGA